MRTIDELVAEALRRGRRRVALAAAEDPSALEAVLDAMDRGLAEPLLVGDREAILATARVLGRGIGGLELHDQADPALAAAAAVALVRSGKADFLMKGHLESSVLLRAVLDRATGINRGSLASHVAVMELPAYHKLLFLTDAAINIAPDLAAKVDIVRNAVAVAAALGVALPKVALLAAVEKVNWERMPCTVDAAVITQMNRRGQIAGCLVDGPLAFDNAIDPAATRSKGIESEVAGDADILVVPSIEAGNILYKCLIAFAGARGAGVVVGAARPIVLTSRADSAGTKLASIALASLAGWEGA